MPSPDFAITLGKFATSLGFDNFPIAYDLAKANWESDEQVDRFITYLTSDDGSGS